MTDDENENESLGWDWLRFAATSPVIDRIKKKTISINPTSVSLLTFPDRLPLLPSSYPVTHPNQATKLMRLTHTYVQGMCMEI